MADNITVKDSTGATKTMRTTDTASVHVAHQVINVGAAAVSNANPVPVSDAGGSLTVDGTVAVSSVIPGVTATSLGKQTDSAAGATDTGVTILAIRDDALTTLTPADGDYTQLRVTSIGRLWTSATIDAALPAGTNAIGGTFAQSSIFWNDSVTAQAASATLTGTARDTGVAAAAVHRYSAFNASAFASHAGTLRIEGSNDNTTWYRQTADAAVGAGACVILSVPIMTRYYRAVYVNGATLQTSFSLNTSFTGA